MSRAVLPPFPVDDGTLAMLSASIDPDPETSERSSVWDLLRLYSEMANGGTDGPSYHDHDVLRSLIAEVRRLRAAP